MAARAPREAAAAARPVLDVDLPVAISHLYDEIDRLRAENARLLERLQAIHKATYPGNRTLDDFIRDMGYANDIARAAIAAAKGGED